MCDLRAWARRVHYERVRLLVPNFLILFNFIYLFIFYYSQPNLVAKDDTTYRWKIYYVPFLGSNYVT